MFVVRGRGGHHRDSRSVRRAYHCRSASAPVTLNNVYNTSAIHERGLPLSHPPALPRPQWLPQYSTIVGRASEHSSHPSSTCIMRIRKALLSVLAFGIYIYCFICRLYNK